MASLFRSSTLSHLGSFKKILMFIVIETEQWVPLERELKGSIRKKHKEFLGKVKCPIS